MTMEILLAIGFLLINADTDGLKLKSRSYSTIYGNLSKILATNKINHFIACSRS